MPYIGQNSSFFQKKIELINFSNCLQQISFQTCPIAILEMLYNILLFLFISVFYVLCNRKCFWYQETSTHKICDKSEVKNYQSKKSIKHGSLPVSKRLNIQYPALESGIVVKNFRFASFSFPFPFILAYNLIPKKSPQSRVSTPRLIEK